MENRKILFTVAKESAGALVVRNYSVAMFYFFTFENGANNAAIISIIKNYFGQTIVMAFNDTLFLNSSRPHHMYCPGMARTSALLYSVLDEASTSSKNSSFEKLKGSLKEALQDFYGNRE